MNHRDGFLELEEIGDTIIATPTGDMGEFDFPWIDSEAKPLLERFSRSPVMNLVVDFSRTDYFGSSALGLLIQLRKQVTAHGGQMVLCGISGGEMAVLEVARLQSVWPICATRDDALAHLNSQATPT